MKSKTKKNRKEAKIVEGGEENRRGSLIGQREMEKERKKNDFHPI